MKVKDLKVGDKVLGSDGRWDTIVKISDGFAPSSKIIDFQSSLWRQMWTNDEIDESRVEVAAT